ncbi:hypothetical protein SAMN05519103_08586 [Rhizobiales bacterium GAS113]|nr:hypothetical protein SAMN05519103_08586 [Rhizobiales bacterium GAS113]
MPTPQLLEKFAYVDRLKAAGIDETQALAHAERLDRTLEAEIATTIVEIRASARAYKVGLLSVARKLFR